MEDVYACESPRRCLMTDKKTVKDMHDFQKKMNQKFEE